ncbi:hypothetical protein GLOTRDRAFT_114435 [Gloeophyllum trabeum ATCC 11539]|uniref:RING-type E3 ubiquitin transferase n=1 Tax=Gloeophyllum trabeum (strain ATCC 11539 / FP-39264 / Madison 617) TaxID=670483 RepID=S7RSY8_GLOTA|nr:uncharacterized protein GLOTRDRAFT_114435 [Gloeophyllum trabeum ATCC 11539]EPQ57800.1 hypothetical protein GLOTRDRAFT_114435 [Gloeophyllum trabeum ATCC 11539]
MSSTQTTTTETNQQQPRARRVNRARRPARGTPKNAAQESAEDGAAAEKTADAEEGAICWICAEPVKYWSVSECNHRTCHVCALRLRALYKKLECTFCKEPQQSVIFTISPDAPFSSYSPDAIPYKDPKLSIFFETQEMMEETLILLRFNCPDSKCDYIAVAGWGDLKLHVREAHGKVMCDLCIRHKKVFAHEQALYPPWLLPYHLPSMAHHRSRKPPPPKEQIEGGVHPLCAFCRECFFSDDELYAHMRERHEECFICKRNEIRDQYFQNYEALEQHFTNAHFPCPNAQCQARKFVVFGSALDLKAHMVEEHGADMSARDKRDALRVQADFAFDAGGGSGGGGGGRRGGRNRDRDRGDRGEPPPQPGPARPGGGGRRREGFGAHLSTEANPSASANGTSHNTPEPSRRPSPSPVRDDVDPEVAERHASFVARLVSVAPNNANIVPGVKAAIRSYRASESAARDLISTIWNVLDRDLDNTASIINALVDLLDEDEKKRDLLAAWNGFKLEQRKNFPDLVPTSQGNEYAGITAGRVLNAKHSTATRSSSASSSRHVWDRVAQAAASSSVPGPSRQRPADRFPPLNPQASAPAPVPAYRQPQRSTPWASTAASAGPSSSSHFPPPSSVSVVPRPAVSRGSSKAKGPPPPSLSKSAFPELPSTSNNKPVRAPVGGNQSLKNILGKPSQPAGNVWGAASASAAQPVSNGSSEVGHSRDEQEPNGEVVGSRNDGGGGRKKGKGKQKQTLFTLGTFPT